MHSSTRHAVFHYFLSDNRKQYSDTTAARSKVIIELFKKQKFVDAVVSNIWYNMEVCSEHYICATALLLLSVLSQPCNIIIYRGISAPGHGK